MKKLHSFALYTLLTPALTLSAGALLAQPTVGQDIDQQQQTSQRQQGASQSAPGTSQSTQGASQSSQGAAQSTPGSSQGNQNTQRPQSATQSAADRQNAGAQSRMENRGFMNSAPANSMHASNLIGADVKNSDDEDVGSVSDLILNHEGQVVAIIVGVGGFLGMGERDVAIGWDDVTRSRTSDDNDLRINSSRDELRSAPEFSQQSGQRQQGASQSAPRASQSATGAAQSSAGTAQSTTGASQSMPRAGQSTAGVSQSTPGATQSDQSTQRAQQSGAQSATDRLNAGTQSRMENRGFMNASPANGMHASNLIGADVKTSNGEDVGPISDLLIDHEGQVVAIIIGVGGFLGIGERDVAIGWDDVTRSGTADSQEVRVDVTRESLRSAPEFKKPD
jgi:sporulation protein YlmC with PRC-barrel domain